MTREEKIERARILREGGMSYTEIAKALGERYGATVCKWLNPERTREYARHDNAVGRHRKRAWDRRYQRRPEVRGACSACGELMGIGKRGLDDATLVCLACRRRVRRERAHEIERMWADGMLMREIAAALGWTMNAFRQEFARLRAEGFDLPHRYNVRPR